MSELTKEQLERQDFVDNYIFNMVNDLVPDKYRIDGYIADDPEPVLGNQPLEWDIEWISEIREAVQEIIADKLLSAIRSDSDKFEMEFYPYIKETK